MRKRKPVKREATEGWMYARRLELADPAKRVDAAIAMGDWARDMCLMMGASIDTAYFVGGTLAEGLAASWRPDDENNS